MSDKKWKNITMEVNGLKYDVKFNEDTINNVFVPFLKKLTELHGKLGRKIVAYIAAPPATGKTTVTQMLEKLSKERSDLTSICTIGIDGFHYSTAYMKAHFAVINGSTIPMEKVKGAPETYDLDLLQSKIREVRQESTEWPLYDRKIHDVIPDALTVEGDIILIEGNYLLLKDSKWTNIRALADYTVFIKAAPELLKERLINRKVLGGLDRTDAELFYNTSDKNNAELVINNSAEADETWVLQPDGDYLKEDKD